MLDALSVIIRNRGVVEWFIAPVLKTGDPLRGPGVRIPPPLRKITQNQLKTFILNSEWRFFALEMTEFE